MNNNNKHNKNEQLDHIEKKANSIYFKDNKGTMETRTFHDIQFAAYPRKGLDLSKAWDYFRKNNSFDIVDELQYFALYESTTYHVQQNVSTGNQGSLSRDTPLKEDLKSNHSYYKKLENMADALLEGYDSHGTGICDDYTLLSDAKKERSDSLSFNALLEESEGYLSARLSGNDTDYGMSVRGARKYRHALVERYIVQDDDVRELYELSQMIKSKIKDEDFKAELQNKIDFYWQKATSEVYGDINRPAEAEEIHEQIKRKLSKWGIRHTVNGALRQLNKLANTLLYDAFVIVEEKRKPIGNNKSGYWSNLIEMEADKSNDDNLNLVDFQDAEHVLAMFKVNTNKGKMSGTNESKVKYLVNYIELKRSGEDHPGSYAAMLINEFDDKLTAANLNKTDRYIIDVIFQNLISDVDLNNYHPYKRAAEMANRQYGKNFDHSYVTKKVKSISHKIAEVY